MVIRSLFFIVFFIAFLLLAYFLYLNPGELKLLWFNYEIQTSAAFGLLIITLALIVLMSLYMVLKFILKFPSVMRKKYHQKRKENGLKAFTKGMIAVAAGDEKQAMKFARQAEAIQDQLPVTLLLSAQALRLRGAEGEEKSYYEKMSNHKQVAFLGYRGLLNQAIKENNMEEAQRYAEKALAESPKSKSVFETYITILARRGFWLQANDSLIQGDHQKLISKELFKKYQAIFNYEISRSYEKQNRISEALEYAYEAFCCDPAFTAGASQYILCLLEKRHDKQAIKIIEKAWKSNPHMLLVHLFRRLDLSTDHMVYYKNLKKMVRQNSDHIESHIALGEAAMRAKLWGVARDHFLQAIDIKPNDARAYFALALLEEKESPDQETSRQKSQEWHQKAINKEKPEWVCQSCGKRYQEWQSICHQCHNFDVVEWTSSTFKDHQSELSLPSMSD